MEALDIANLINYKEAKIILNGKEFPFYIDYIEWINNGLSCIRKISGRTLHLEDNITISLPDEPAKESTKNCRCNLQDLIREGCKCGGV